MKTETKHTQGPWRIDDELVIWANDEIIARTEQFDPGGPLHESSEANAALIASAPDLLAQRDELREALRDLITHDLMCCETDGQEPGEMCRKAQAALAKCEPQQAQAYPGGRWK